MGKQLKITITDNLIFVLFSCWCLVDALNGLLLRNNLFSISQIYKVLIAIIIVVRCWDNRKIKGYVCAICFYLSFYIVNIALHGEEVGASIALVSKLLTSILFFLYFTHVIRADENYFKSMAQKVFKWNFVFFAINMFLGIMGLGYAAYGEADEGIGSKGFFYAGNELSGVVAAVFPWVFYYIRKNYSLITYYVSGALLLILVYTLSTKSGIFATLLLFVMIALFYGDRKTKNFTLLTFITALIYIVYHIQSLLGAEVAIVERFNFFLERDGLLNALTAGRLDYWEEESVEFYNSDVFTWIFGLGGMRTVEMDPPDSLLNCGLIGLIILLFFYIKGLSNPFKRYYANNPYKMVVFSSNLILIIISISAGHILFSSMAGMLIALSNAMLFIKGKKRITIR